MGDGPEISDTLVVIVPACDEADTISEAIAGIKGIEEKLAARDLNLRIYVVDDGSVDSTGDLARRAGADRVLRNKRNLGLGAAVRTGLMAARADGAKFVVKIDADLQHDPEDILAMIEPIRADEAEVVYGNRFDRMQYRMPLVRRIGNLVFAGLMRWLTNWPLRDSAPGLIAFDRTYLKVFHLPGDYNYSQQLLLDAYHKGMRFAHVDVTFRERTTGQSFISLKYPFKVLPQILMVLVAVRPMRIFAPVGLFFLGIATVVAIYQIVLWALGMGNKPVQNVNLVLGTSLFGLQTLFFGILAELIVKTRS